MLKTSPLIYYYLIKLIVKATPGDNQPQLHSATICSDCSEYSHVVYRLLQHLLNKSVSPNAVFSSFPSFLFPLNPQPVMAHGSTSWSLVLPEGSSFEKRVFPTVTKCLLVVGCLIVGVFYITTIKTSPYSPKYLNATELN